MANTRPDWGGPNADIDIHIEEHLGLVDSTFEYSSKLAPYVDIRSLRGTQTSRIDRLGDATVSGRKAGEALVATNPKQDKSLLVVDTTLYVRNTFDYFDDWTSSIVTRQDYGRNHGIALAKQFDVACLTQAMQCGDFIAPTHLQGAFHNGVVEQVTITNTPASAEADAGLLSYAHRKSIENLIDRDLGDQLYAEGICFVTPRVFTILLEHKYLTNVEYQGGGSGAGNNRAMGRIAYLNGIRVMETPRIPTAAVTSSPLGSDFLLTATQAKREMITIIPSLALHVAQVHGVASRWWDNEEDFQNVLDTWQAYNIGKRRPDAVALVEITGF